MDSDAILPRADIRALTGIRGVAALLIVIYHYQLVGIPKAYLAVDLFFVLSGFVMALTYGRGLSLPVARGAFGKFLWKRFARIYPIYAVVTLMTFWLPEVGTSPSLKQLAINLLLVQQFGLDLVRPDLGVSIVGQGWSISAELVAYLLFPAALGIGFNRSKAVTALGTVGAVAIVLALNFAPPSGAHQAGPLDHHWRLFGVARCLSEFYLGIVAFRSWKAGLRAPGWVAIAALAFVGVVARHFHGDAAIVFAFVALILCAATEDSFVGYLLGSRPIHYLGEISYSLYLLHILPFFYLRPLSDAVVGWLDLSHPRAASLAFLVCVDLILSAAALKFIERPCRDWLRSLTSGRRPQEPLAAEPAAP